MPSHKIHLAIAKKINEKLDLDLDSLMLGSVLPDLGIEKNHQISHYQNGKLGVEGTANPDIFVDNYWDKLDNTVIIGYLVHLLTDKFFNTFVFTNFFIYDHDGNDIGLIFKGKRKLLPMKKIKYFKQREFSLYDDWLLNNGYVSKFNNFDCIDNVIDLDVAKFDKNELKKYIKNCNNDIDGINFLKRFRFYRYKLTTKEELDKQFNLCCEYIIEYVDSIKYKKR